MGFWDSTFSAERIELSGVTTDDLFRAVIDAAAECGFLVQGADRAAGTVQIRAAAGDDAWDGSLSVEVTAAEGGASATVSGEIHRVSLIGSRTASREDIADAQRRLEDAVRRVIVDAAPQPSGREAAGPRAAIQQFRAALALDATRRRIGIDSTDDVAFDILADNTLLLGWYEWWRVAKPHENGGPHRIDAAFPPEPAVAPTASVSPTVVADAVAGAAASSAPAPRLRRSTAAPVAQAAEPAAPVPSVEAHAVGDAAYVPVQDARGADPEPAATPLASAVPVPAGAPVDDPLTTLFGDSAEKDEHSAVPPAPEPFAVPPAPETGPRSPLAPALPDPPSGPAQPVHLRGRERVRPRPPEPALPAEIGQFRAALGSESRRRELGLDLTSEQALAIATDDETLSRWFAWWSLAAPHEMGLIVRPVDASDPRD